MSILLVIAPILAAGLYLLAWRHAVRAPVPVAAPELTVPPDGRRPMDGGALLMIAGVVAHAAALATGIAADSGFRFGFALALSATFWVGALTLWLEGLSVEVTALRRVVLPVAAGASLLPMVFPGSDFVAESHQPLFMPHLIVGTLAYGVLMLAALHASLMTAAERALHGAGESASLVGRWIEQLPPLLVLERILFRFIALGFVLLTLTAVSGVLFSEQVFGRPMRLDHKTVFTLMSWALFGVLLIGRRVRGWRGRTALRLTLVGFTVLLLGYVGSRFVLEVILQRG